MLFDEPVAQLGATTITLGETLIGAGALAALAFVFLVFGLLRTSKARSVAAEEAAERAREAESRMAEIMKAQTEMQARIGTMAEVFGSRQSDLNKAIGERLDGMTSRLGQSMTEQTKSTHENLAKLQERLAVIDTAQNNIQSLATQVVELQSILSNKQTRGAFGQNRMEAIVADGLPIGAYEFQAKLTNDKMPDCLIHMPNGAPPLVVDAKFPLEGWNAIKDAAGSDEAAVKLSSQNFRRDIEVHIKAISEKYLIPGETQDTAFMFVPSESIFADIHENFESLVQKAHRARVVIVSPSLLMLSIQVVQALLKDARMREQAHLIQAEVLHLMKDLGLLGDRVAKLQTHFLQAGRDIEQIQISTSKLAKRGAKIEALEFDNGATDTDAEAVSDAPDKPDEAEVSQPRLFSVKGG